MLVCGCVPPHVSIHIAEDGICGASVYWLALHQVIGQKVIDISSAGPVEGSRGRALVEI